MRRPRNRHRIRPRGCAARAGRRAAGDARWQCLRGAVLERCRLTALRPETGTHECVLYIRGCIHVFLVGNKERNCGSVRTLSPPGACGRANAPVLLTSSSFVITPMGCWRLPQGGGRICSTLHDRLLKYTRANATPLAHLGAERGPRTAHAGEAPAGKPACNLLVTLTPMA